MAGAMIAMRLHGGGALWNGAGFIAGESPDGLVTVNGAPGARYVYALERSSRLLAGGAWSASDGTWRIDNLEPGLQFDVIGRDHEGIYNDTISSRVEPWPYEVRSLTGAFTANDTAKTLDGAVEVFGGEDYLITVSSGAEPTGITFEIVNGGTPVYASAGRWLIANGTAAAGSYAWTLTVATAGGHSVDLVCTATFT